MPETYVCPYCGGEVERDYRVQYVIRSCGECGEHGRFVHEEVAAALDELDPEGEDLPDGWGDLPLDERLLRAVREGLIDRAATDLD
ncbi:hypothetical protein [Halobaculum sp. EA56]|uniref:hypothetical protein n=1 Tax=Halobaculum sp. EA56 TaxID=3421648 RepID=UPI003EBCEDD1